MITSVFGIIGGSMVLAALVTRVAERSLEDLIQSVPGSVQANFSKVAGKICFSVFGFIGVVFLLGSLLSHAAGEASAHLPFNYDKDVGKPMDHATRLELDFRWQRRYLLRYVTGLPKFQRNPDLFVDQWEEAAGSLRAQPALEGAALAQVRRDLREGHSPREMFSVYKSGFQVCSSCYQVR